MNAPNNTIFVGGVMRSGTSLLQKVICTSTDTNQFTTACRYLTGQLALYAQFSGGDSLSLKVFDKKATYTVTLCNTAGKELKKLTKQRAR